MLLQSIYPYRSVSHPGAGAHANVNPVVADKSARSRDFPKQPEKLVLDPDTGLIQCDCAAGYVEPEGIWFKLRRDLRIIGFVVYRYASVKCIWEIPNEVFKR